MRIEYILDDNDRFAGIRLVSGFDGYEPVKNLKEAVSKLQVENIAVSFNRDANAKKYDNISDEAYNELLNISEKISQCFKYFPDDPENKGEVEMNVMSLLKNVLEFAARQCMSKCK